MINKKGDLVITWSVQDILDCAKDNNIKISVNDAKNILCDVNDNHDCEYGINWQTIRCTINDYIEKNQK